MNIRTGNNNINFGWSCETHKQIMNTALKDFPQFNQYKDILEHYVQQPDHDDIGFLANKHFYFGNDNAKMPQEKGIVEKTTSNGLMNAFKKIFNTDGVSFLDYNGKSNAKAAYEHHIDMLDYAAEDGDTQWAIENAARAMHFLQDMTQPQHTENTTVLGKAADLNIHNEFEDKATAMNETLSKNYFLNDYKEEDQNKAPRNYMKLFNDVFKSTRESDKITEENKNNWDKITQKQFNTAVQATKESLQNLSNVLNMS